MVSIAFGIHVRVLVAAIAAVLFALAVPSFGAAQTALIGSWQLNLAKSHFSPGPPFRSLTITYDAIGQGMRNSFNGIDADGKSLHGTFTVIEDGKYHPVTGVPDYDESAYKRIDANTLDNTRMKAGRVVQSGRRMLSPDGRTLTFTQTGVNANGQQINDILVYDKQ